MTNREKLEKAVQQEAERQSQELVIDFDAAIEEEKQRAITVRWEGKEYKIPDTPPEWFRLMILRFDGDPSMEGDIEIMRRLFGEEFADKLNKASEESNWVNVRMANQKLMNPIINRWFGFDVDGETKKKKTPASSSGDGERSRPTSSDSTESTSTEPSSAKG